jgi:hypothetical protein
MILGPLLVFMGGVAFIVAMVALIQPLPRFWMGTRRSAIIAMVLSVASCGVGSAITPMPPPPSPAKPPPSVAEAPPPAPVGPLQDAADSHPKPLEVDPEHPSVAVVRHIEATIELWDVLDRCRRDPAFKLYFILPGGPCGNLAEVATSLRESSLEKDVYQLGLQCSAGDVSEAAIDYVELAGRADPEQAKYVSWVRGHIDECRRRLPKIEPKLEVTRAEMGSNWPLTVDAGTVGCDHRGRVWFEPKGSSIRYAVNGTAKPKFGDIKPIWARDPSYGDDSDGIVMRKNMSPLIEMGRSLC